MELVKRAVVCPIYNETDIWMGVCAQLAKTFDLVVIVDDGSDIAPKAPDIPNAVVLRHRRNLGKGHALATGFRYCLEHDFDLVATVDGDGEHDPRNFDVALQTFEGRGMVILSRAPFFGEYGLFRRLRNLRISRRLSRELGMTLADTQSGMRIFSASALRIAMAGGTAPGYGVETEMLRKLCLAGVPITEIPMVAAGLNRASKKYANTNALVSDMRLFLAIAFVPRWWGRVQQALFRRPNRAGWTKSTRAPAIARAKR